MAKEEKQQIVDYLNLKIKLLKKLAEDFEREHNRKSEFLEGAISGIKDIVLYGIESEEYKKGEII